MHDSIQPLLKAHARTFALTLRLLPRELREPLSIAYLLARASDTIADANGIPRNRRLELLQELQVALNSRSPHWKPKPMPGECSASEMELLDEVPALIAAMERHPDGAEMFQLWRQILEGQIFDLQRFVPGASPLTREELEGYCYLVAGSVGEAWTQLIGKHFPLILNCSPREMERMLRLGRSYGKGLQLLNILRDRDSDRQLGRTYLEERDVPEMMAVTSAWLEQGGEYCLRLSRGRIRYASEIPLQLALRTLRRLRERPQSAGVKISHWEVYQVLLRTLPSLGKR